MEKGTRIGAILSSSEKKLKILGYGVFEGEEIPPADSKGMGKLLHEQQIPNPKMRLDNGIIIWGFQCWWGTEVQIKEQVEAARKNGHVVETVTI